MKLLAATLTVAIGFQTAGAQNLLENPGFEEVKGPPGFPFPAVWFVDAAGASADEIARTGDWSLRLRPASDLQQGASQGYGNFGDPPAIPATPGVEYELSAYALHPSAAPLTDTGHVLAIRLRFINKSQQTVGVTQLDVIDGSEPSPPATDVWHERTLRAVAPPTTAGVVAELVIVTNIDQQFIGLGYFDDATLVVAGANPADFNGDGAVDAADLATLIAAWGPCAPACPTDLDADAVTGASDLAALVAVWTG
jgi:hypothetical protein